MKLTDLYEARYFKPNLNNPQGVYLYASATGEHGFAFSMGVDDDEDFLNSVAGLISDGNPTDGVWRGDGQDMAVKQVTLEDGLDIMKDHIDDQLGNLEYDLEDPEDFHEIEGHAESDWSSAMDEFKQKINKNDSFYFVGDDWYRYGPRNMNLVALK